MGTTQPIRNKDELTAFRMYYKDIHPNSRKLLFNCDGIKHSTKNQ